MDFVISYLLLLWNRAKEKANSFHFKWNFRLFLLIMMIIIHYSSKKKKKSNVIIILWCLSTQHLSHQKKTESQSDKGTHWRKAFVLRMYDASSFISNSIHHLLFEAKMKSNSQLWCMANDDSCIQHFPKRKEKKN